MTEKKDIALTFIAVLFLPLLPCFDFVLTWKNKKLSQEQYIPAVASLIILGVTLGFSFQEYNESVVDTVVFLNRVLSFLLPLNLTACIAKNKLGLSKFRSMCMEFQEVAWLIKGFKPDSDTDKLEKTTQEIETPKENILKNLRWLPLGIKHDIRRDFKTKSENNNSKFEKNVDEMIQDIHTNINKLELEKPLVNNMFRTMNRAVALLSDIKSIQEYLLPDIFFGFFYIVVGVYFMLLPLSIDDTAGACFLKCYAQLYVFMGMFFVGLYIQNAFRSSSFGIQTVKKIHEDHEDFFVNVKPTVQELFKYSDNLFTKRYY